VLLLLVGHPERCGINHAENKGVLASLGSEGMSVLDGRRRDGPIPVDEANLFHEVLDGWLRGKQEHPCGPCHGILRERADVSPSWQTSNNSYLQRGAYARGVQKRM